ncbi:MAG: TnpV protein [Clostridia bacterium]|nr:TnpV protein [Clostridia bacterium]
MRIFCKGLEWVRRMNNIRNRAEKVILNEIIYR